uniref:Uncharacterized protein n=1 Tax=Arundo donax TaxID=35708 RepID=A0A0A8XZR2_ARUDO
MNCALPRRLKPSRGHERSLGKCYTIRWCFVFSWRFFTPSCSFFVDWQISHGR